MSLRSSRPSLFLAPEADHLIDTICRDLGIDRLVIEALIQLEGDHAGKLRRHGLFGDLEQIIDRSLAGRNPS